MESHSAAASGAIDVVVGLGSNLGERRQHLELAVAKLAQVALPTAVSPLYETQPVGGPLQSPFLNAAIRVWFEGSLHELLDTLLEIERGAGRIRRERWGPRTLDLDILWAAHLRVKAPGLEVPHAQLRLRAFALRPLLDVAPDARDPGDGRSYHEVLRELGTAGTERLESSWISW